MPLRRLSRRKLIMLADLCPVPRPAHRPRRALCRRATTRAPGATPTGRAPACCRRPPITSRRASIVFTGNAGAWKGIFAVHSWIVLKPANAREWTRYDVVGWGNPVRINGWPADGRWYGNTPVAIADISGPEAEKLIPQIEAAVEDYRLQPGRRLSHLAGAEQQQLHRRDPARGAGTGRGAAAERGRPRFPRPASMPAAPTAAPASSSICAASPRSSSAGSRASRSTCSGWSPGSICAIPASSCRASAASASNRRSPPRSRAEFTIAHADLSRAVLSGVTRARRPWQVGGQPRTLHARHAAAARPDALPRDPPRQARHAAGQCRLSLQPVLLPLPRQCRPESHRGNVGRRSPTWCSISSSAAASRRSTSPAARPSSMRISAAW